MQRSVTVHRDRTTVIAVGLGFDVSADTITSQIRVGKDEDSPLIAEWDVTFADDGTDGELVLTLDDSIASTIVRTYGFMDLKRVTGGEPIPLVNGPIPVFFQGVVTA